MFLFIFNYLIWTAVFSFNSLVMINSIKWKWCGNLYMLQADVFMFLSQTIINGYYERPINECRVNLIIYDDSFNSTLTLHSRHCAFSDFFSPSGPLRTPSLSPVLLIKHCICISCNMLNLSSLEIVKEDPMDFKGFYTFKNCMENKPI